jgi:NitT/TauT family transport system permease protein
MAMLEYARRNYSIPLLLLLWELAAQAGLSTSRLLPPPSAIFAAFVQDVWSLTLVFHAWTTVWRALAGFLIGSFLGVLVGAVMGRIWFVRCALEPLVFIGYPAPKIALFPIFTFIFGFGAMSKVAFISLECFYPLVVMTYFGVKGVNTRLVWTAQNFGASTITIFTRVVLPAAFPSIMNGLRIALPIAIIVAVLTEMIGDSHGLGHYISNAATRFRFAELYAGIVMIGLCGWALDAMLNAIRRRVLVWQGAEARF